MISRGIPPAHRWIVLLLCGGTALAWSVPARSAPDEGTAMEAWYAHSLGKRVVAYTGGTPPHPWTVYVAAEVRADLEAAVAAVAAPRT